MNFDFSCDIGHIKLDVPHQIWEATSADGSANTLITRFFHNTPSFYANNLLRCYVSYFSPEVINQNFTILGLILFFLGLWNLINEKRWKILIIVLLSPLSPLLDFPNNMVFQAIVIYGAAFLVILFGVRSLWKKLFALKKRFC